MLLNRGVMASPASRAHRCWPARPQQPLPRAEAAGLVLETDADTFLASERLAAEVFGPFAVVMAATSTDQLLQLARRLVAGVPEQP